MHSKMVRVRSSLFAFVVGLTVAVAFAGCGSAKPEVAVHMTKTQMRAYAARESLGDVTETDGDVLTAALRGEAARQSFAGEPKSGEPGD